MHQPWALFEYLLHQCVIVSVAFHPELIDRFGVCLVVRVRREGARDLVGRHEEFVKDGADLGSYQRDESVRLDEAQLQILVPQLDT